MNRDVKPAGEAYFDAACRRVADALTSPEPKRLLCLVPRGAPFRDPLTAVGSILTERGAAWSMLYPTMAIWAGRSRADFRPADIPDCEVRGIRYDEAVRMRLGTAIGKGLERRLRSEGIRIA